MVVTYSTHDRAKNAEEQVRGSQVDPLSSQLQLLHFLRLSFPGLVQVELGPSQRYVEVPIPGTSECDLIWKWIAADVFS